MSFLLDGDESATLEATLAFVDSWNVTSPTDSSSSSVASPTSSVVPSQQLKQQNQKKKPRRKYPNSSSTVLQRRKKAEILALRDQAEQLEMQLQLLQKNPERRLLATVEDTRGVSEDNCVDTEKDPFTPLTWKDEAAIQYKERLRAEKTNRKLKCIMNNQVKVQEALRTLLQKSSVLEGMDFVWQEPCRPLADAPYSMEQLEKRVERLYLDADLIFQSDRTPAISVSATVKEDRSLGKMVELVSTTPMRCPLQEASNTLWNWFTLKKVMWNKPNTLMRNYSLQLKSDIGTLDFQKKNIVRRFEETNRVVVIWADILQLPKFGIQFRNETWMLVSRSADDPRGGSVLQTFQHLYMDCQENHPVDGATFAQEPAFEELSKMYRQFLQSQQNTMMEKTRRSAMIPQDSV